MEADRIPEAIIARFRTTSLERVGRVEALFNALVQGSEDEEAPRMLSRDLHTLKGDARIVGYEEVHLLSHRLEELVGLAEQMHYRVSEDFELVVTMATQFLGMLLRKRGAMGIDLAGFLRQIDEVMHETRVFRRSRPTNPRFGLAEPTDRLSERTRQRIAVVATDAFLEYLGARSQHARARLRGMWQALREELSLIEAVALRPLLERHLAACRDLATELGKQVELDIDIGNPRLDARVADAVDEAVLHLVRNAIDHGIEAPAVRTAAGKPASGRVRVFTHDAHNAIELVIADDGSGIDLERVRAKGTERNLLDKSKQASDRELVDLVFMPGFTTKTEVSSVSGRGIGMDVVKTAIARVGGQVRIQNKPATGVTVTLVVPAPVRQLRAYQFLAPGGTVNFAVSARWTPTMVGAADTIASPGLAGARSDAERREGVIDPLRAVALASGSRQTITSWQQSSPPPQDLVMQLRWGFLQVALRTATEPQLVTAERICPTADDHPIEVVIIDGVEALLLRPEHLQHLPPAQIVDDED